MTLARHAILVAVLVMLAAVPSRAKEAGGIAWQGWTDTLFDKASAENRFVILDLEAVWCHWCHVMEEETYSDPDVRRLIGEKYIAVRVDQDANPDLSSRYGDWGWPATIIFGPDGSEIAKLRGYVPAPRMISLLQAIIDDPTPGPSVIAQAQVEPSSTAFLTPEQRERLVGNYDAVWDEEHAGWGTVHKFIHTESLDYAMTRALAGDESAKERARRTLDAALNLLDPVWGGVYQYSDERDWRSPHYEKIMWYQAQYLRQYALAYATWGDEKYLEAAQNIRGYLTRFLSSPEGVFYTSQDADLNRQVHGKEFYAMDDKARRALGVPKIDKNVYARENGLAIGGLAGLYNAAPDPEILREATTAARWIIENRALGSGGFRHGENDRGGPYLADTLAMGQAFLDLYAATGGREWLERADKAGDFIAKTFRAEGSGFMTAATPEAAVGALAKPVVQIEENIQLARFANLLFRYTGEKVHRETAEHVMGYLTSDHVTGMRRFLIGVVLADMELASEPVHITVVGGKDDPAARRLHKAALAYPSLYKRVDWWDSSEDPMLNDDIEYPELERAAAFACGNRICSLPVFDADALDRAVERMARLENARD